MLLRDLDKSKAARQINSKPVQSRRTFEDLTEALPAVSGAISLEETATPQLGEHWRRRSGRPKKNKLDVLC